MMNEIIPALLGAVILAVVGWDIMLTRRVNQRIDDIAGAVAQLTVATGDLSHRLAQLATAVDQTREQLHRALELSSTIHRMIYGALYNEDLYTPDVMSTINTHLIELKAIAVVNGDTEFIERVGLLRRAAEFLLERNPDAHTPPLTVSKTTEDVQRKVYDLLAAATRAK